MGEIDYGSLMDEEEQRLKGDVRTGVDYGAVMDEVAGNERSKLTATIFHAKDTNPDQYAKVVRSGETLGVPAAVVEGAPEDARLKLALRQAELLQKNSPILARHFADVNFAKLAHDQVDELSAVEQAVGYLAKGGKALFSGLVPQTSASIRGVEQMLAEYTSTLITGPLTRAMPFLGRDTAAVAAEGFAAKRQANLAYSKNLRSGEEQGTVAQGVYGGLESLGQNLITMPLAIASGNPQMALLPMAGFVGGQEYGKARDAGKPIVESLAYASSQAVIEYATEKLPMSKLIGDLKASTPFWKTVLHQAATEIPGEQLATVLQDLNEWAVLHPEKPFSSYLEERPSAAAQTLIATVVAVGGQTSVATGVQKAAEKLGAGLQKAGDTDRLTETLKQLTALAEASKLRERSPQTFADFVQSAADEGGVQDIYVDARELAQVLQQSPVPLPPSVTVQDIAEAAAVGGDVKIPLGDYAAHLAGSEAGAALLEHLKTSPEQMSQREAQTFYQEQAQTFQQEAEKILNGQVQDAVQAESAQAVREHFAQQLAAANRFTPAINEAYASLMGSFYTAMAQRLGLTPQEMLARYPLQVAVENIVRGMALEQREQSFTREQVQQAQGSYESFKELLAKTGGVLPRWLPERSRFANDEAHQYVAQKGEFAFGTREQAAQYARGLEMGQGGRWGAVQEGQFWRAQRVGDALKQGSRGQISFGKDIKQGATITLHNSADLSTFLHESGHFYLEVLADVAAQPNAPAGVTADMNAVLAWLGVKSEKVKGPKGGETVNPALEVWRAMSLEEKRPYHEKFARGFEAYLFEGKAPSTEVESLFGRFRAWLLNVYKSLKALNVELSDEVRSVFDRMLASEEEIRSAEGLRAMAPMFGSAQEAKATTAEWQSYQALGGDATTDATRQLERRSLADLRWLSHARSRVIKGLQAEADAKRKEIRQEVEAEVRKQPVYAVQRFLKNGELPTGEKVNGAKISMKALKEMYGEEPAAPWRYLATNLVTADVGLHPDALAEMFGFTSGDHLVRAILAAEPEASVIDGMTDQRMLERHGELVDEQAIERAADQAVHNEARARFVAAELRFLDRVANVREKTPGGGSVNVLSKAARQFAERVIAAKKLKDIKPNQYTAAEARAARAAQKAKDVREKAVEKRNQLVNLHAARIAHQALDEVDKSLRYLRKFDAEGTRKNLDQDYLDQIDQLLERFDLRRASQADVAKRAALADWIESQQKQGFEPTISKALQAEAQRQHYSTMTLEEFRGLVDAVKNIEHLGRLKKKLLTAKDEREFAAVVDDITATIGANAKKTLPEQRASDRDFLVRMGRLYRTAAAIHRKFASLVRGFDGFKDGGVAWEYLVRNMNERGNFEAVENEKATLALTKLLAPIVKAGKLTKKQYFPSIGKSFTREERLGIALNMGNEVNRERILTGERLSPAQLNALLDTLTQEDWNFVQGVWDYLESFRPQIAAKERRVSGVEPEWVEPTPVMTKFGVLKGGYYPIAYDPLRSEKSSADLNAEVQRQIQQGLYTRSQTARGHLKARDDSTGRPLRYDFGEVISRHVTQVVHDLAWHEYLIDANRLLRSNAIENAVKDHYGKEVLTELKDTLKDIAIGNLGTEKGAAFINHLRYGTTIAGLALNVFNSLQNLTGITQSMSRIGTKWVLKGAVHWAGDAAHFESAVKEMHAKSDQMRLRAKTMQREINDIRNKVTGNDSRLQAAYFYLQNRTQLIVDTPTWWGAYEKAMAADEMTEDKAIALADQAVLDAQGGGQIKDLAGIQRGHSGLKLFTTFYSYFNTTLNNTAEAYGRTNFRKPAEVALFTADLALLYAIPALLSTLLKAALQADWDDEEKLARKIIGDQISYMLGTIVGLRELTSGIQAMTGTGEGFGYSGPASVRFFSDLYRLGQQIHQGDLDAPFWKALNSVGGTLFHYPSGQINRTVEGIVALGQGETSNPGAVLMGPPPKH